MEITDPYNEVVAARLAELLEGHRGDLPETLWMTALTMIERSTERTKAWHWWRTHPDDELRRLRERIAEALRLARFAAHLQEADNDGEWEAGREVRELQEAALARRGRDQTMEATLHRLAKAAGRKASEGRSDLVTEQEAAAAATLAARPERRRYAG